MIRSLRLSNICEIHSGGTPPRSHSTYFGGDIPWAKISDIEASNGLLVDTEETITPAGLNAIRGRMFPAGTLLFAMYGSIGKMAFAGRALATNQAILGIQVRESEIIIPRYLYRWLGANTERLVRDGQGIAQKNLSAGYLRDLVVPVPPMDEQRSIVRLLDRSDELRQRQGSALRRLDSLVESLFVTLCDSSRAEMTVTTLADLVETSDKINYGVVQPGHEDPSGIPLVRVANIVSHDFRPQSLKCISRRVEKQYARSRLKGDELLVACVGSIGAVALADSSLRGANIARAVARVPIDPEKANRIFIAESLKCGRAQSYFKAETRTVAQPTLNIKQLGETPLCNPPLHVQNEFAKQVIAVRRIESAFRESLHKLDLLFASLEDDAFRSSRQALASSYKTPTKMLA